MRPSRAIAIVLLAFLTTAIAQGQASQSPQELAFALQKRYDGIRDFSAEFEQRYRGGVLRRETVERGTLLIRKPGRMRWEYTAPEPKLFISDGTQMYFYVPADKQVTVSPMPDESGATTPALFLAGRGNLTRDFSVSFVETAEGFPPGTRALRLDPRTPQTEYDWLVMLVDPATLGLRGLMAVDGQGGTSTFTFTNLRENINPPEGRFLFEIPRGVDVVAGPR